MADKAKAKAKSLMDEHGDMIVYGSIAGGGLLIAAITFFIVRRCCCSSGNARDTRDVGKRQSRLKQRHMEDRGGGSQFSMKRQMMYKNGVYAPSERVMHNNWSGDADGNAMDPFNRDGYRQGGRPPRGRTPPMHQRGRQAPPRGFAGGARRSNAARSPTFPRRRCRSTMVWIIDATTFTRFITLHLCQKRDDNSSSVTKSLTEEPGKASKS